MNKDKSLTKIDTGNIYDWAVIGAVFLIPSYLIRFTVASIPTNMFEMIIVSLAIVGIILTAVRHNWHVAWKKLPHPLIIFVVLFLAASFLSTYISASPRVSLGILKGWIVIPLLAGWLVWVQAQTQQNKVLSRFTNTLLLSGVFTAVVGLVQLNTLPRVQSIYDVPNSLALWLSPLVMIGAWQSLTQSNSRLLPLATAILFGALLATQSTAGLSIVMLCLIGGVLLWRPPFTRRIIVFLIALTSLTFSLLFSTGRLEYLVAPLYNEKISNSISVRGQLWSVAGYLIIQETLFGLGLGQFEPAYQAVLHKRLQAFAECGDLAKCSSINILKIGAWSFPFSGGKPLPEFVFRDPHNWILSFWLNTGLLGLISFIGLHVWLARKFFRSKVVDAHTQALALAVLSLLLFGLVDTIYWKNDLATLHWILIVLLATALQTNERRINSV